MTSLHPSTVVLIEILPKGEKRMDTQQEIVRKYRGNIEKEYVNVCKEVKSFKVLLTTITVSLNVRENHTYRHIIQSRKFYRQSHLHVNYSKSRLKDRFERIEDNDRTKIS